MFHECLAYSVVGEQESSKLLRKNIVDRHAIPGFCGKFIFRVTRLGYPAKVAFGQVTDFIVIVKHDAAQALPGYAEVLQQQIPREDICRSQFLDRIAIAFHQVAEVVIVGLLRRQV